MLEIKFPFLDTNFVRFSLRSVIFFSIPIFKFQNRLDRTPAKIKLNVLFVFRTIIFIKLQGIHFYIIFLSVSGNQGVNLNNEIFKISISTSIRSRRCRIRSDRVKETRRKWKASDSWKSSSFNFDLIIKAIINAGYIYVAAYAFLTDQI